MLSSGAFPTDAGPMSPSQKHEQASKVRVYTSFGPVSTRGISVSVPGFLELYIYGRIFNPGLGTYCPRVPLLHESQSFTD